MKKILPIFCVFCFVVTAHAVENDELTKVRTWSMEALAQTIEELMGQISEDALVAVGQFAIEKNGEFSAYDLMETCSAKGMSESESVSFFTAAVDNHNNTLNSANNVFVQLCEDKGMNDTYCANCDPDNVKWSRASGCQGNEDCATCHLNSGNFEWLKKPDGTWDYNKGTCYIEVIGWYCLGGGTKSCSRSGKKGTEYTECYMVRKYIDAKQPFKCDIKEVAEKHTGRTVYWSGCAQHGYGQEQWGKKPPFNIAGNWNKYDCQFPLASHISSKDPQYKDNHWRFKGDAHGETPNFHADGSRLESDTTSFNTWCMANECTKAYDIPNTHNGDPNHLIYVVKPGETVNFWKDKFPHHDTKGAGLCKPEVPSKCNTGYLYMPVITRPAYIGENTEAWKEYNKSIAIHNGYMKKSLNETMTKTQCNELKDAVKVNWDKASNQKQNMDAFSATMVAWNNKTSYKFVNKKTEQKIDAFNIAKEQFKADLPQNFNYYHGSIKFSCTGECKTTGDDIVTCKSTSGTIVRQYKFNSICNVKAKIF